MLGFLLGFLTFSKIRSKSIRVVLTVITVGLLIAASVYAVVVFNAIVERKQAPYVQPQSSV